MPEIMHEIKRLQKLNRGDLMILLGQLEEELEKTEQENERLKDKISGLEAENSALQQEKNSLLRKNGELVDTLQAVNKRLVERESQPANWQAVESFARELSEASRQAKEQVSVLKQLEQKRREEALSARETALREAARIVEAAQQEASLMMQRVKVKNLEMLSSIQAAVSRAHQEYGAEGRCEKPPAVPAEEPQQAEADGKRPETEGGGQPGLSTDQLKQLLKVIKRLNRQPEEEAL